MLKCEECDQAVIPYSSRQRFCCRDCRNRWNNRRYHQMMEWWKEHQQDEHVRVA
jgi:transposase-like protein